MSPVEVKRQLLLRLISDHGLDAAVEEIAGEMVVMQQRLDGARGLVRMNQGVCNEN